MKAVNNCLPLIAASLLVCCAERPYCQSISFSPVNTLISSVQEGGWPLVDWCKVVHNKTSVYYPNKINNQIMETPQTERNKAIIRSLYEDILNQRKFDVLGNVISEDYVGVGSAKGPHGFIEPTMAVINGFPDIKWQIDDIFAAEDKVVVRWHWLGTNTASFRGIPASDKQVTDNAIVIYQLKDSKIIRAWMQGDRLGVLMQIGAIPASLVPGIPKVQPAHEKQKR